jgi:methionyl-tRNA synthetase
MFRLQSKGYIYRGKHSGWYSVIDETFFTESQTSNIFTSLGVQRIATETGRPVEWVDEENYMFASSKFHDAVKSWLLKADIFPEAKKDEVLATLKAQSSDISVSRPITRQHWGIGVPTDSDHTIYVWFEALINYLTACGYPCTNEKIPQMTHIIGKDIARFHLITWPAMLIAAEIPLPKKVIVHSHWTVDNMKMSKSVGNVIHPDVLLEKYGADAVRYFIVRDAGLKHDSEYSENILKMRYHVELADRLGNLLSRCFGKAVNPKARMPSFERDLLDSEDIQLVKQIETLRDKVDYQITSGNITAAFEPVSELIAVTNKYITRKEPWKLVKKQDQKSLTEANNTLYICLEALRVGGILMQPVMPSSMSKLLEKLNVPLDKRSFSNALFDHQISREFSKEPLILYRKM